MLHRHYDNYNQFYSQHVQNHQFQGFADQDRKFTRITHMVISCEFCSPEGLSSDVEELTWQCTSTLVYSNKII